MISRQPHGQRARRSSVRPMLSRLLQRYDAQLVTRPLTTKSITAFGISCVTDVSMQRLVPPPAPKQSSSSEASLDAGRIARQSVWSGAIMAPILHYWFKLLERVPALGPLPAPIARLAVDSATLMPLSHVFYFAYMSFWVHGGSTTHISDDLQARLLPALKAGYVVIPATMLVNLTLVPLRFRVLFVNLVLGAGWGGFLNLMANTPTPEAAASKSGRTLERRTTAYT